MKRDTFWLFFRKYHQANDVSTARQNSRFLFHLSAMVPNRQAKGDHDSWQILCCALDELTQWYRNIKI